MVSMENTTKTIFFYVQKIKWLTLIKKNVVLGLGDPKVHLEQVIYDGFMSKHTLEK